MSISVNPINSSYYINGAAATYANNTNSVHTYDELLAIENNFLLGSSSSSGSGSVDAGLAGSDLLTLSPAALRILNGIETEDEGLSTGFGLSGNGLSTQAVNDNTVFGTTDNFTVTGGIAGAPSTLTLTASQQSQAAAIIAQYANQPATQQTFAEIEGALTAAGINPQQLSIQQLLGAYNLSYGAGFSFNDQLFTETLASELDAA